MSPSDRRPVTRAQRLAAFALLAILVMTLLASAAVSASAATARRTWQAQLAANGASGTATLSLFWAGNGTLALNLTGLGASAKYPVIVYRGTCVAPIVIVSLPETVTDAAGAVATTSDIPTTTMATMWAYARGQPIAIRVGTGAAAMCGALRFPVATRIAIPSLKIDLPVIRSRIGYPPCNVAIYLKELAQPGEPGVTFIYSHARKGMFLPLLERSKINNGASLLGLTVQVWTSNDLVSTYEITRVRRHVTTFGNAFDLQTEQLWIQTSEGPRGTVAKLILIARRTSVAAASHAAANPVPRPVACG